jgi:hypothetical protein
MGLENEVVATFLRELRKDARIDESAMTQLQELLNQGSLTQKNLLGLIRNIAGSKGKKRQH